jgi:hypothetical protein
MAPLVLGCWGLAVMGALHGPFRKEHLVAPLPLMGLPRRHVGQLTVILRFHVYGLYCSLNSVTLVEGPNYAAYSVVATRET